MSSRLRARFHQADAREQLAGSHLRAAACTRPHAAASAPPQCIDPSSTDTPHPPTPPGLLKRGRDPTASTPQAAWAARAGTGGSWLGGGSQTPRISSHPSTFTSSHCRAAEGHQVPPHSTLTMASGLLLPPHRPVPAPPPPPAPHQPTPRASLPRGAANRGRKRGPGRAASDVAPRLPHGRFCCRRRCRHRARCHRQPSAPRQFPLLRAAALLGPPACWDHPWHSQPTHATGTGTAWGTHRQTPGRAHAGAELCPQRARATAQGPKAATAV